MKNQSAARQRSPFAKAMLAFVGIALFLGFMALGTWQVQRRAWKLDLIERVEQRVHSAPVALPEPGQWPQINAASHEYLPVKAQGRWLDKQSVLAKALTEAGAGFWLMTPLQLSDGTQVLVNGASIPRVTRIELVAEPGGIWKAKIECHAELHGEMAAEGDLVWQATKSPALTRFWRALRRSVARR